MKTPVTINRIDALIMLFLFLSIGIYSAFGQSSKLESPVRITKNAGNEIDLIPNMNHDAKAIALNNFINSPFMELKPALTPNGDRLYFSRSLHPLNTGGEADYEDIWYSDFNRQTNEWAQPARLPGFLNNMGPNFINSVSTTGDTIILGNQYTKKGRMRAGLSYSVRTNGQWSDPAPITIENDYNISDHANAYVSLKNGIIISAIERAETTGSRDLYISFWDGEKASEPINMGRMINTEFEESSPFLDSDLKTLYFASKGHHGHGGYDIYKTVRLDDSWTNWSKPQNLGPAVNGAMDDEFFSITHCGKYAIFSKQITVHNTNLFKISIQELHGVPTPQKINTENPEVETRVASIASL